MTRASRVALLVAAPPLGLACLWVAVLVISVVTGQHPVWDLQPRNLAEAAVFRDRASVVRLVRRGDDINLPAEIRAGVLRGARLPVTLTPIEAAVLSREREMVQLMLEHGASPDARVWHRAFCLDNDDGVRELLAARQPAGASETCGRD